MVIFFPPALRTLGETQHSGPLEESGGFRLATPEVVGFVVRPPSQDAAVVANEGPFRLESPYSPKPKTCTNSLIHINPGSHWGILRTKFIPDI